MNDLTTTAQLQRWLDRLGGGDSAAREQVLGFALRRCESLAQRMLRQRPDLRDLAETGDVLQQALLRLHKALEVIHPVDVRAFLGLAARQTRWVLGDFGRELSRRRERFSGGEDVATATGRAISPEGEPADLLEWAEFHEAVEKLPEEPREVFDLLYYHGVPQEDAAACLGVSVRTIKLRWQRARLLLRGVLRGGPPSE